MKDASSTPNLNISESASFSTLTTVKLGRSSSKGLAMRRSLIVLEPTGVRQITLEGTCVTLGRDDDNDVVIADPTASRRHAAIEIDEDGARVVDMGSRNGTALNGLPVKRFALKHRDVLTIGATRVRFSEVVVTYRDSDLGIAP